MAAIQEVRAALVPESFFFDVGGSRNQSIVDPDLTIPVDGYGHLWFRLHKPGDLRLP